MHTSIILFCGLLAVGQGQETIRVVNGTNAEVAEFPFQVSLQRNGKHFCGGSIVNRNFVLTAAHCVVSKKASDVTVVLGTIDIQKPYQTRQATKLIVHVNYTPVNSHRNDIALIKVHRPFIYTPLVQPISLPIAHIDIPTNSQAILSGWGRLGGDENQLPHILQKAQIYIADQSYCRAVMEEQNHNIYSTNICANDPSMRKGQCNGDSGGPLTVNGRQVGIVSWSIKDPYCASTKYPGVYTRVPEFIDWINVHAV